MRLVFIDHTELISADTILRLGGLLNKDHLQTREGKNRFLVTNAKRASIDTFDPHKTNATPEAIRKARTQCGELFARGEIPPADLVFVAMIALPI